MTAALGWHPGIGDPDLTGWVLFISYLIASFLCVLCAVSARAPEALPAKCGAGRTQWIVLAAVLFLLGINKQMDFQTLLTEVGRLEARKNGWYESRRLVQFWFISGLTAVSALAFTFLVLSRRRTRHLHLDHMALLGIGFLLAFTLVRAASFHHVDRVLSVTVGGLKVHRLLEFAGIACLLISALRWLRFGARGHIR